MFIGRGDLPKISNEVFEKLSPGYTNISTCSHHTDKGGEGGREARTLKAVGKNLSWRSGGRHGRVKDAVMPVGAAVLVLDAHASNASRVHAPPAAAALQAPTPL